MISANVALLGISNVPKKDYISELKTRLSGNVFIAELIAHLKTIRA